MGESNDNHAIVKSFDREAYERVCCISSAIAFNAAHRLRFSTEVDIQVEVQANELKTAAEIEKVMMQELAKIIKRNRAG